MRPLTRRARPRRGLRVLLRAALMLRSALLPGSGLVRRRARLRAVLRMDAALRRGRRVSAVTGGRHGLRVGLLPAVDLLPAV
ncbi:hypothetical protein ACWEQG_32185 [Microbispora sp. NPDC004025]